MDERVWVGLICVRPGPNGEGGAYAYCAGRGDGLAEAFAAIAAEAGERGFEILEIDWFSRHAELDESRQAGEGVAGVLATLADGAAALDYFFSYPEDGEADQVSVMRERVESFVGGWIEGAVANCGPFELGDFAFAAEMRFPDDDEVDLGWAYNGLIEDAPAMFARAAEAAGDDEEDLQ